MEYPASSANVSPQLSNGYSAIFAAPAKCKLSPTVDYTEIFCGGDASRASPIPVLDVPELRERNVSPNVGTSKLDYADIFGPFRDSDYAVSFEELIAFASPEGARTPAYTRSHMEGSGPYGLLENQSSSHEVPCHSLGEVKQFKMLHHQTNQGSNNGTTHIAQLHVVPGYTHLSDENTSLQRNPCHYPVTSVESDARANIHCGNRTIEGICSHKSVSRLPPGGASKQISEGGIKFQRKYRQNKSFSTDMLFDVNNSGLGMHPPKVPQPSGLSSDAGDADQNSKGSMTTKISDSKVDGSEASTGAFSPPYFVEDVDENSVAAASAAAVKIAIEKAQARMKRAKQLMKKKKEGLQNRNKLSFKDGLRTEKRKGEKVAGEASQSKEEEAREICKNVKAPIEPSAWTENKNAVVGQVTPDSVGGNKPVSNKEAVSKSQEQELTTAQAVCVREEENGMETEEQFREHLTNGKDKAMSLNASQEDHVYESMSSNNWYAHKEIRTRTAKTSLEKPVDSGTECKGDTVFYEWDDSRKKMHANEGEHAKTSVSAQEVHDQEDKAELDGENGISAPYEQDGYEEEKKQRHESIGIWKNVEVQEFENENISPKEAVKMIENDNKIETAEDQEERINRSKSIREVVGEVRRFEDIFGKEENGKSCDGLLVRVENERESEEPCKWEENEKQQKYADSGQNTEMTGDQAHKQEVIGEKLNKFDEGGENEAEDIKSEENEKLEESEVNEQGLNEACQMLENEKKQEKTCERGDTVDIWTEIDQREADEKTVGTTEEELKDHENDLVAADDLCKHDENEHLNETKETCVQKEIDRDMGVTTEATVHEEDGRMIEISESSFQPRDYEKVSVEMANDLDYNEMLDTHCATDGALDLDEMIKQMKEANVDFFFNVNGEKLGNIEIKLGQKQNDQYPKEAEAVFDRKRHLNELDENDKSVMEAKVSIIHEEKGNKLKVTHGDGLGSCRATEAAQQPSTSDRRDKTTEIVQGFESSQSTGNNEENHCKNMTTEEKEAKDSLKKEVDQEKEQIKKLVEAKEKEKERIAVARAIREARGRAFVEARERAAMEKLAVGARGKPVTETRERLVNYRSSADKEAKLRVERAAVERATSEARDRVLGKSRYGNAASDARSQAEKFSCGSWDDGMRQSFPSSDAQDRSSTPSSSSRNSDSSNHGVLYSKERSEGANSEVAQKSKAELERQQRTALRAAKALAEKNARDLLAQKEQAEKNRLAETLDADIKRWSSGKEGNLRALLSTLHYILGPASGWQAVPLTDMIATAAVKKTYRRATLFVHPDKLQQRGANIQQKYMCEKVFDLLKDAWDRFNREER